MSIHQLLEILLFIYYNYYLRSNTLNPSPFCYTGLDYRDWQPDRIWKTILAIDYSAKGFYVVRTCLITGSPFVCMHLRKVWKALFPTLQTIHTITNKPHIPLRMPPLQIQNNSPYPESIMKFTTKIGQAVLHNTFVFPIFRMGNSSVGNAKKSLTFITSLSILL